MSIEHNMLCNHCGKKSTSAFSIYSPLPDGWISVNTAGAEMAHFCGPQCIAARYRCWLTTAVDNIVPLSELMKSS